MKNISKKFQEMLIEWYGGYINRYLQAIEDAGYYVIDIEEVKSRRGSWAYLRLGRCDAKYFDWDYDYFYMSFGPDDLKYFYVGEQKIKMFASRFSPELLKEFLIKWEEIRKMCRNCL